MSRWQPIKTAPKKGRRLLLLLVPGSIPQVAFSNTWWTAGFSVECRPKFWMPIDDEPKDEMGTPPGDSTEGND